MAQPIREPFENRTPMQNMEAYASGLPRQDLLQEALRRVKECENLKSLIKEDGSGSDAYRNAIRTTKEYIDGAREEIRKEQFTPYKVDQGTVQEFANNLINLGHSLESLRSVKDYLYYFLGEPRD
ncbi:hypothetical protein ACGFX8_25335 [Streptomyces sp. NPDC048362]|uniref:hypothetical protein n=1 Tax=Streptomyces sp. NPDC048362 TaxID=3365539 RepID=UPI0037167263